MEALAKVTFDGPTGHVCLDTNRQAIGPNYVSEIQAGADGKPADNVIEKVDNVNQTLDLDGGMSNPASPSPSPGLSPSCP